MRKLIQTFIETKMKTYQELEGNSAEHDQELDNLKIKYPASLWMISSVIGIMTGKISQNKLVFHAAFCKAGKKIKRLRH